MFAGKTQSLLRYVQLAVGRDRACVGGTPRRGRSGVPVCPTTGLPQHAGVLAVKPSLDVRSKEGSVECHNGARATGVRSVGSLDEVEVGVSAPGAPPGVAPQHEADVTPLASHRRRTRLSRSTKAIFSVRGPAAWQWVWGAGWLAG